MKEQMVLSGRTVADLDQELRKLSQQERSLAERQEKLATDMSRKLQKHKRLIQGDVSVTKEALCRLQNDDSRSEIQHVQACSHQRSK